MHGEREEEMEGTELAAEWAFSSLQKFGQEFLKKLRGKKMPNKLLERVSSEPFPFFNLLYVKTYINKDTLSCLK